MHACILCSWTFDPKACAVKIGLLDVVTIDRDKVAEHLSLVDFHVDAMLRDQLSPLSKEELVDQCEAGERQLWLIGDQTRPASTLLSLPTTTILRIAAARN